MGTPLKPNFFRKTSLDSGPTERNPFRELDSQLNELVIKHLGVFLRLNPQLEMDPKTLEKKLGLGSMSHLERRDFVRQLEDHFQPEELKIKKKLNQAVKEYFNNNSETVGQDFDEKRFEYPNNFMQPDKPELEQEEVKSESGLSGTSHKEKRGQWLKSYFQKKETSKGATEPEPENVQIKNRMDMGLEDKLLFYQVNKHNYFSAVFFFSFYDILKDSVVNIILLFMLNNVNGLSLICILVIFGCRFVFQTHFNDMVLFLSFVFCARLFAFLFSDDFPQNSISAFFVLANKNKTFLVCEAFVIGSSIFILIPTMFLVKIVFEDFRLLTINKRRPFFRIFNGKTCETRESEFSLEDQNLRIGQERDLEKTEITLDGLTINKRIYLNLGLWLETSYSWVLRLREILITKGHYLFPLSLFLLSQTVKGYSGFFKLFVIYDCVFKIFLKKSTNKSKRIYTILQRVFMGVQISVLLFIIYSVLYLMIKRRQRIDQVVVNMFVLLNFKIIFENCLFVCKDRAQLLTSHALIHEAQNLLNNHSRNEDFLLQKMDRLLNYDRILFFKKYGDSRQRSLSEYVYNNWLFAQRNARMTLPKYLAYFTARCVIRLFAKLPRFSEGNLLFLGLALQTRFSKVFPDLKLNALSLLTNDGGCLEGLFRRLKGFKTKMQTNNREVVKGFYRNLKGLGSELDEEAIEQVFIGLRKSSRRKRSLGTSELQTNFLNVFGAEERDTLGLPRDNPLTLTQPTKNFSHLDSSEIMDELERRVGELRLPEHLPSIENFSQKTQELPLADWSQTSLLINGYKYQSLFDPQSLELNLRLGTLLRILQKYLYHKIDVILEVGVIVLSMQCLGVSSTLLLGFFLFFFCLENSSSFKYKLGCGVYLIFLLSLLLKPLTANSLILQYFLGDLERPQDYILVVLLSLLLSNINRKINKRFVDSTELFTESVLRISLNGCFQRLPWRYNFDLKQLFTGYFRDLHARAPAQALQVIRQYLLDYSRFAVKLEGLWPKLFINLKLLNKPKEHKKYRESFIFRNFSHYNTKSFSSHFQVKILLLLLFLALNIDYFLFYKRNVQNLEEISQTSDSIDSLMALNISLAFLFFLLELIFVKFQTTNINSIYKIPALHDPSPETNDSLKTRFRRAVSKLTILQRFLRKDTSAIQPKSSMIYKAHHRLVLLKYALNIALFCYLCFVRFVWLPSYDEIVFRHSLTHIIFYKEAAKMQMIAISLTLYLYFDLAKLTGHRFTRIESTLNIDFKSQVKKIVFKVYMAIPYLLEFKTVILFVCSRTSLDILKWFKIEDIKALLINAKFYVESEKRKTVGQKEGMLMKVIMFLCFFVPFFLLLIVPFVFFSDLNPLKQSQKVTQASLVIGIADSGNIYLDKNFIKLVVIDLLPEDSPKAPDLYSESVINPQSFASCACLKSYISSKTIFNYNDILYKEALGSFSKVHYKLNVSTVFHNYSYFNEVRNNNFDFKNFRKFLQQSCQYDESLSTHPFYIPNLHYISLLTILTYRIIGQIQRGVVQPVLLRRNISDLRNQ